MTIARMEQLRSLKPLLTLLMDHWDKLIVNLRCGGMPLGNRKSIPKVQIYEWVNSLAGARNTTAEVFIIGD